MSDFAPEQGPDGRPRPRYGEYATPEEQRARIAQPEPVAVAPAGPATSAPGRAQAAPPWDSAPPAAVSPQAARRPRTVDRIATFALLGYGFITVVMALPALIDYLGYVRTFLSALGVDADLSDPAGARAWGVAAAIVLGVGWLLTAFLSVLSLRARRLTWWIPLVAGVVFNFASAFLMLVPVMSDPTVWSALESALTGG